MNVINKIINIIIITIIAEYSEIEDTISKESNKYKSRRESDLNMKETYKVMNNKIINLKKLEFDFTNVTVSTN